MLPLRLLPTLAIALVLSGCSVPTTITPRRDLLKDAPTQVQVQGQNLSLHAYLGRDFMPAAPPDGRPMVAVLRVRTVDGSRFPAGVTADKVSVVYGDRVWTAATRQEHPSQQAHVLEVIARDGPKWGPDVRVDVIVYLHDAAGRQHLLRAPDQLIESSH
ncbi:MAG: hypothetical protein KY467_15415 [Gemmatimonadetes bacterium]|nr:hypothetical protein [Gemmatimonadota bacterium]